MLHRRRNGVQLGGDCRIFAGDLVEIADLDVGGDNARPFGAGAEKPALPPDDARGVKRAAGNELLDALSVVQVRSDCDAFGTAVGAQQKQLDRITEIV